jgi:hypothetical protein
MINNPFQLKNNEFLKAIYFELDEDGVRIAGGVKFYYKQHNKSGRGVAKGQTSARDYINGSGIAVKDKFSIETTANLPFKVGDEIHLKGNEIDGNDSEFKIRDVDFERSSTNNIARSNGLSFKTKTGNTNNNMWNPVILELR